MLKFLTSDLIKKFDEFSNKKLLVKFHHFDIFRKYLNLKCKSTE